MSSADDSADPLTEFLSEETPRQSSGSIDVPSLMPAAAVLPVTESSIRAAVSPAPLFVFLSEQTLSDQGACVPRTRQKAGVILDRAACRVIGLSLWVLVTSVRRSVVLLDKRLLPFLRLVWCMTIRTGRRGGAAARTLSILSSARITTIESRLRDIAARLRAGYARRRAAVAAMTQRSMDLYPRLLAGFAALDARVRHAITRLCDACARARVALAALKFQPPHIQAYMARSHPWAYPVGLFLSGALVGASLATVAYLQLSGTVAADAAVKPVSASARQVDPSPVPVRKPAPIEDRTALSNARAGDAAVPTTGDGTTTRPRSTQRTPARTAALQEREPPRVQIFRGSLAVRSDPDGAAVFMNGQQVGTTPLMLKELPIGSRALRLTLDGYEPWSRSVQVVAQQHTTVAAALQQSR